MAGLSRRSSRWVRQPCKWGLRTCFAPRRQFPHFIVQPIKSANGKPSAISNVLTGRPVRVLVNHIVREVGPLATDVPSFPLGALALEPLRKKAESEGSTDFTGLTAGEAAALCRELPAGELTLKLATETLQSLGALARPG
jgi:nitronate monooxygenase